MKPEDVKEMNIPSGAIIELVYVDSSIDNEPVYFENIGKRKNEDGVDILFCRLRPKLRVIKRNLEAIEGINVYRVHRKYASSKKEK